MRWWNREVARQLLALVLTPLCLLVPGGGVVRLLAVWDIYAALYLPLTWLAYRATVYPAVYSEAGVGVPR